MKKDTGNRIVGFNILEDECIWAKAGVISFKRCGNAFDCNSCRFDKAMLLATQPQSGEEPAKPALRQALATRSSADRQCRHMLTGRVDYRLCDHAYDCGTCEFDQALDDMDEVRPAGIVPRTKILGFTFAETYYYHDGHTWARIEYGGRVRIGVDDFAMRLLGRPDKWECPDIGKRLQRNRNAFSLQKGLNRASFLSPVEGTVMAVNRNVARLPELAHSDPFEDGWLLLVEPVKLKRSLKALHFGQEGKNWLVSEVDLLHEMTTREYGRMAATGAVPVDDVIEAMPEIGWDSLVETFLR